MTSLYEKPLWEWRKLGAPSADIQISPSLRLQIPSSPSIFRISFRDDPIRPNVYFFVDPESGVLADWSHIERYRDIVQITLNFWQSAPAAKVSIGLSTDGESNEPALSFAGQAGFVDHVSGQTIIEKRDVAFNCKPLLTDVSGSLPLECRAVTPSPLGGTAELGFSSRRGADPMKKIAKIVENLSKIERSFCITED